MSYYLLIIASCKDKPYVCTEYSTERIYWHGYNHYSFYKTEDNGSIEIIDIPYPEKIKLFRTLEDDVPMIVKICKKLDREYSYNAEIYLNKSMKNIQGGEWRRSDGKSNKRGMIHAIE